MAKYSAVHLTNIDAQIFATRMEFHSALGYLQSDAADFQIMRDKLTPSFLFDLVCRACGYEEISRLKQFDDVPNCQSCGGQLLIDGVRENERSHTS